MTDFAERDRIAAFDVEAPAANHDLEQERRVAIYDLLEDNRFRLVERPDGGPYRLSLARRGEGWTLTATPEDDGAAVPLDIPAAAMAAHLEDYRALCESYRDAVRRLAPSQIELVDNERRALHSEASEALRQALSARLQVDPATARRLFTVLCAVAADDEGR